MFSKELKTELLRLALDTPQEEICGFVVDDKLVPCENIAEDRTSHFEIKDPIPQGAQALYHSHPNGPFYPSRVDMEQQRATALPWLIAAHSGQYQQVFEFGDQCPIPPLVGRGFRHGVTDCYALIRDFYRVQYGIAIKEFPRDWEWWNLGEDLYAQGFEKAGFVEVDIKDIAPGDVFLATIRSDKINHGGIYLGNDLILHHTSGKDGYDPSRLSTIEPAIRWLKYLTKVVRYENRTIDRTPIRLL